MSSIMQRAVDEALEDLRLRSKKAIYQRDPEAWLWDILGKKWWSKQQEVGWSIVENEFTIVKSSNGVGKSALAADVISWFVSVHDPRETTVLVTAPVREQIDTVMFRYLNDNYRIAAERGTPLIGEITRWPKWTVNELNGRDIVLPKRPADQNLISSYQGIHDRNVLVVMDEAGGLPEDMFIGANAVTTNEHARILAIGNPDKRNTGFHRRFTDDGFKDWNRITISSYDTPNFTGEIIHPEDLDLDKKIKSMLVQKKWADMMIRSAHASVIAAKVYGEFPEEGDDTFFTQEVLNTAFDKQIEPDDESVKILGVDISYRGEDSTTAYLNTGGRIRRVDSWNKTGHVETADRIHRLALDHGAHQVRVDAAGTGAGVFEILGNLKQYEDRLYTLIGINGANSSPDKNRWLNSRAWAYDMMREGMALGKVDLDFEDLELKTELTVQTYEFTKRNQLQMTSKSSMRSAGIKSPDHLDAVIYSYMDLSHMTDPSPIDQLNPGDRIYVDPEEYGGAPSWYIGW